MIYPKSKREVNRFVMFLRTLTDTIAGRSTGYRGAADDNYATPHCHTAVARYVRRIGYKKPDDVVVIVGSRDYYDVAHSLVVNRAESAMLTDTMGGYFEKGRYVVYIGTHRKEYEVYAAYKIEALLQLSRSSPEEFEENLMKLRTVHFKGSHIPKLGKAVVTI